MKQKFSQFSVGELEAGARKRQGLAEARRHAQVREIIYLVSCRGAFVPTDVFVYGCSLVVPYLYPSALFYCFHWHQVIFRAPLNKRVVRVASLG